MTVCIDVSVFSVPEVNGIRLESGYLITENGAVPLSPFMEQKFLILEYSLDFSLQRILLAYLLINSFVVIAQNSWCRQAGFIWLINTPIFFFSELLFSLRIIGRETS